MKIEMIMQHGRVLFTAPEGNHLMMIFHNLTGRNFRNDKGYLDIDAYRKYINNMGHSCGVAELVSGNPKSE